MTLLEIFRTLQDIHDNLRTIDRDLTAFPPELAALDLETKTLARQLTDAEKSLTDWAAKKVALTSDLEEAQKLEDVARRSMKAATQKVQYAAAIRDLDDRERQKAHIVRPLKEAEARCAELGELVDSLKARSTEAQGKFQELHQIFLAEHETQVLAKGTLCSQKEEMEKLLPAAEIVRFQRLIQTRHGRAVVAVENSTCQGCRVKLRMPFLAELRTKTTLMACESCQRIVYLA
jgi:predicted  nucleic acid-binding Zn-ribbon protein